MWSQPATNWTYQTANASANVEDGPEPGKVATLLLLSRVGQHDGALRRPQHTGAHPQQGACEDVEAGDIRMDGHEQTDGVDTVTNASKGQRETDTQTVHNGTGKETDDGEGTVQRGILACDSQVSAGGFFFFFSF